MSAQGEPTWPAWLRRRTGVEHLGPPDRFFAWTAIALSFLVMLYVGVWNAQKYPISLGYDAQPNAAYAHILLDQHHIPRADQSAESLQPPGYYLVAGVAARFGLHWPFHWREARTYPGFPEASYRGAQYLNVPTVMLTGLCVLLLARLLAPRRRVVWAASVGFFAFLPVVSKTAAMFHPEPLNMLISTAAILAAVELIRRKGRSARGLAVVVVLLAAGLAVRGSAVFTAIAIAISLIWLVVSNRQVGGRALPVAAGLLIALIAAVAVLAATGHSVGTLTNLIRSSSSTTAIGREHFFAAPTGELFSAPYRPHFVNAAVPETYTEIWGDWIGAFAWSSYGGAPPREALDVLRDQSWIGVIPTLLALSGFVLLVAAALRRPELVPLALLPPIAVMGYLVRSYKLLSPDGDLLKASYLLTTAPIWALAFGLATASLAARSRLLRYGMLVLFPVFAVLELRFMLYGVRDGLPIF